MPLDYSIHYRLFHDNTKQHALEMSKYFWSLLHNKIPADRDSYILDVGCGFGFALQALRNAGYHNISGLETSAQQANIAQAAGFSVEVVRDTTEWLRKKTSFFDAILLFDVLEHVPVTKQVLLLQSIKASLKQGGKILVQVPNASALLAMRWRYSDFTHYSSYTEHSLFFALANAGFTEIHIGNDKGIGRFPRRLWRRSGRAALRKWIVRWAWLQVYRAELPWDRLDNISFDLNLLASARA